MKDVLLIKDFLEKYGIVCKQEIIEKFKEYHRILFEENSKVNLISRKQTPEDVWVKNIYDSLLIIERYNFNSEVVLDFGTGGGLPGIPLKIVFPDIKMYLLDSKLKKINILKNFIKKLDLKHCYTISLRLEEIDIDKWNGFFDLVLSRSVKIEPDYAHVLLELVKEQGRIFLYKGKKLDDVKSFDSLEGICQIESFDVSKTIIGTRNLVEIKKL